MVVTADTAITTSSIIEPVLEIHEIQGHLVPGFNNNFQTFLFLEIIETSQFKYWLAQIHPSVTTLETVLNFQKHAQTSQTDAREHCAIHNGSVLSSVWINVAFSFQGLNRLTLTAHQFTDSAFKNGLHNRSELLGDPTDQAAEGNCHQWVIGGPHNLPDLMLILASDDRDRLTETVNKIEATSNSGFRVLFQQHASVLPPPLRGHEHFGFRDCISQPCIRGRISDQPDDFITPHDSGHDLIWPGEFIFGYPRQNPTHKQLPGAITDAGPAWAKNGSFLVFRRLRQNVEAFHAFLQSMAQDLSKRHPNFAGMTADQLAAKLMGRWFSGTPILHAPDRDTLTPSENNWLNNSFAYERAKPSQSNCSVGTGDRLGLICPHAAHMRKAFPRDTTTIAGDEAENQTHRLLRRGIPFGEPVPALEERGLLFLAYQTSIDRQFEFITTNWINNPNFPESDAGHDPIMGQNTNLGENRVRTWTLPVQQLDGGVTKISIELPTDWVIPTGGGYFSFPLSVL